MASILNYRLRAYPAFALVCFAQTKAVFVSVIWLLRVSTWFALAFAIPGSFLIIASACLLRLGDLFNVRVHSLVLSIWSFTFLVLTLIGCGALGDLALQFTHYVTMRSLMLVQRFCFPSTAPKQHGKPALQGQLPLPGHFVPLQSWRLPLVSNEQTAGNTSISIAPRSGKHL